eukprot:1442353-Rhodomonas_salina.1
MVTVSWNSFCGDGGEHHVEHDGHGASGCPAAAPSLPRVTARCQCQWSQAHRDRDRRTHCQRLR